MMSKNGYGYVWVYKPNHPRAHQNGMVFEHILVMEKRLGRPILKSESIHHKNGNKDDNRIENLELMTKQKHTSNHKKKDMSGRICLECGSNKTRGHCDGGRPLWLKYQDGFICHKCYSKLNARKLYYGLQ